MREDYIENLIEIAESRRATGRGSAEDKYIVKTSDAAFHADGIGCNERSILVRAILRILNYDEHYLLDLHFDHKLIQSRVLTSFIPELCPRTMGLNELMSVGRSFQVGESIAAMFPDGAVLKPTRGHSSSRDVVRSSCSGGLDSARYNHSIGFEPHEVERESFIVQELLDTVAEYRVHTLGNRIVPKLTFCTYGVTEPMTQERRNWAESLVSAALSALPHGLLCESLSGWDVALLRSGKGMVIEINPSGYYRVHEPGFHCSGNLISRSWGPVNIAHLLAFIEAEFGTSISLDADVKAPYPQFCEALLWCDRWRKFLTVAEDFEHILRDLAAAGPDTPDERTGYVWRRWQDIATAFLRDAENVRQNTGIL